MVRPPSANDRWGLGSRKPRAATTCSSSRAGGRQPPDAKERKSGGWTPPARQELPDYNSLNSRRTAFISTKKVRAFRRRRDRHRRRPSAPRGEIPYRLTPGSTYLFADLSGPPRGIRHARLCRGFRRRFTSAAEITLDDLGHPREHPAARSSNCARWKAQRRSTAPKLRWPARSSCPGQKPNASAAPSAASMLERHNKATSLSSKPCKNLRFETAHPARQQGAPSATKNARRYRGRRTKLSTVDGHGLFVGRNTCSTTSADGFRVASFAATITGTPRERALPAGKVHEGKTERPLIRIAAFRCCSRPAPRRFAASSVNATGKVHIGEKAYACRITLTRRHSSSSERSTCREHRRNQLGLSATISRPAEGCRPPFQIAGSPAGNRRVSPPNQVLSRTRGSIKHALLVFLRAVACLAS